MWYHISWRGWFKTEKGGRSVLNYKVDFCTLLWQPDLLWDKVSWLGKNKLMAAVNLQLFYTQVLTYVGLDQMCFDSFCFMYKNWKEAVTLGPEFVNGTSKLRVTSFFFFRLEEKLMVNYNIMGMTKNSDLDFSFVIYVLNKKKKIIIKSHIKCVRTYPLHRAVPIKWLLIGHLVTQNIFHYYLQAPE